MPQIALDAVGVGNNIERGTSDLYYVRVHDDGAYGKQVDVQVDTLHVQYSYTNMVYLQIACTLIYWRGNLRNH